MGNRSHKLHAILVHVAVCFATLKGPRRKQVGAYQLRDLAVCSPCSAMMPSPPRARSFGRLLAVCVNHAAYTSIAVSTKCKAASQSLVSAMDHDDAASSGWDSHDVPGGDATPRCASPRRSPSPGCPPTSSEAGWDSCVETPEDGRRLVPPLGSCAVGEGWESPREVASAPIAKRRPVGRPRKDPRRRMLHRL